MSRFIYTAELRPFTIDDLERDVVAGWRIKWNERPRKGIGITERIVMEAEATHATLITHSQKGLTILLRNETDGTMLRFYTHMRAGYARDGIGTRGIVGYGLLYAWPVLALASAAHPTAAHPTLPGLGLA